MKPTSHFILPDVQVKPGQDYDFLRWAGQYAADHKPDVIVCIGDFADMPSLSLYDVGKKSFEGRRYIDDIEASKKAMSMFLDPINEERERLKRNKSKGWNPRMVLTLGNHECVSTDTEILTVEGWKYSKDITLQDKIANTNIDNVLYFEEPLNIAKTLDYGYMIDGIFSSESVSSKHNILVDGERTLVSEVGSYIKNHRLSNHVYSDSENLLSDIDLRLITWTVCDGTLVKGEGNKHRVQFKLSKQRKIDALQDLLKEANLKYTIRKASMSENNKLQPYYICLYGDEARYIFKLLNDRKEFPLDLYKRLNKDTTKLFIETLAVTDGGFKDRSVIFSTTNKHNADVIQLACTLNGYGCKVKYDATNTGFSKNPIHKIMISYEGVSDKFSATITKTNIIQEYIAIQTSSERILTRRNGKISLTGNCRITRAVELDRKLEGLISLDDLEYEKFGWEVIPFLQPVNIDGVLYAHYFVSGVMGRPVSSAKALVTKKHMSCVMGHVQQTEIDMSQRRGDGTALIGLFCGLYTPYDEAYLDPQTNVQHKQIWLNREVKDGFFYPQSISLNYLERKYKKTDTSVII